MTVTPLGPRRNRKLLREVQELKARAAALLPQAAEDEKAGEDDEK